MLSSFQVKRSSTTVAILVACSLGLASNLNAAAFDVGNSTTSYAAPPAVSGGGVPINVGGHIRVVTQGSTVTAAEYAAVQQVVNTGAQTLTINDSGAAIAGRFSVNQIPTAVLNSLAIPHGVTAIQDFAKSAGSLTLPGTLSNNGTFFAVSTSQNVMTAALEASNIYNGVNALLTTVLPQGGLAGYSDAIANLNLTLSAAGSIVNHGTISSAGALNIIGTNVNVDNTGGKLIANGAINIGDGGTTNVTVVGGDLLSNALNLHAANAVQMNVGQVTGVVNVNASGLAFNADTPNLLLGQICLSGDPVIANHATVTLLNGSTVVITAGEPLNIVAGDDIVVGDATAISTVGGPITMTAGAAWTAVDANNNPIITGSTATGGKIDLTGITTFTSGGGNISMLAYFGSNSDSGTITLPTTLDLNAMNGTTAGGSITLTAEKGITVGKVTAFGPIAMTSEKVTINSPVASVNAVSTPNNISINTNYLVNDGAIKGKTIIVASNPGHDLELEGNVDSSHSGTGNITASDVLTFVATPAASGVSDNSILLKDGSHYNLTAVQTNLIANGLGVNARVETIGDSLIHTHSPITVYSQHLVAPEPVVGGPEIGIDGSPLKWITPTGKGVLSSAGDLRLTTNIIAPGQNISILAGGNITAASNVSMIDSSSMTGQSGSVTIVSGYHFTDDSNGVNTIYKVDAPTSSGGSVLLPNVSIKTSNGFTGPEEQNKDSIAGSVTVVAHGGDTNAGVIFLKDITAKGTSFDARGGNVLLIGQGGVKVGNIDTSAVYAAHVSIYGAEPVLLNGPLLIQSGNVISGATFTAAPVAGLGASLDVGKINASTLFARAGNVTLASDSAITVRGDITAVGQRSLQHGTSATAGGVVNISSLTDDVTVNGSIDVSGAKKLGEVSIDPNGGANAGNITISSPSTILITGNLKAYGGPTIGVEHAGNGGKVTLNSTDIFDVSGNTTRGGIVQVNGYIDVHGANGKVTPDGTGAANGKAGNGGTVIVNAGQFLLKGKLGAYSIDARRGVPTIAGAPAAAVGTVTIDTYAVQSIPNNFNLLSNKSTEIALPGGKLTVGVANPTPGFAGIYNGVIGGIINDTTSNALTTGTYVAGQTTGVAGINLTVHGGTSDINELQSQNFGSSAITVPRTITPGTLITPARAIAAMQVSRGIGQTIYTDSASGAALDRNPQGGSFSDPAVITVDQSQMRNTFSNFVLDTVNGSGNIELHITGARPTLDLSAATAHKVNGLLDFSTANSVSTLNFGAKMPTTFTAKSTLQSTPDSTVALGFSGSTYKNVGTVSVGKLMLLNNSTMLTVENKGSLNETSGTVLINNEGIVPKLTIKNVGAEWNGRITGASAQLPLASGASALRTLPLTAAHTVDVTVQHASQFFGPFGTSLVPGTVSFDGTLNADNVKVTAGSMTGPNKVVVPTNVSFANTTSTTKNFTVNATGSVAFQDTQVTTNSGNIQVLAGTNITGTAGGDGNQFTANGSGTASNPVGGGISFTIGTKSTTDLTSLLKSKTPTTSFDTTTIGSSGGVAGTGVVSLDNLVTPGHPSGVISVKGDNSVDLTSGGAIDATVKQRGGAVLFSTSTGVDPNKFIRFDGVKIETNGPSPFTPIAYTSSASAAMALIEMDDDAQYETSFGTLVVKKNAIFALEESSDALTLKAFSGPGDVRIETGDTTITLAPGEELILSHGTIAAQKDAIGRRNERTLALNARTNARLAEFSIVSYMQNASYIQKLDRSSKTFNKMLKTAAAVHSLGRGKSPFVAAR